MALAIFALESPPKKASGSTSDHSAGVDIAGNDTSCSDDRAITDGHALEDGYSGTDPHIVTNVDRFIATSRRLMVRHAWHRELVVSRKEVEARTDDGVITDVYAHAIRGQVCLRTNVHIRSDVNMLVAVQHAGGRVK